MLSAEYCNGVSQDQSSGFPHADLATPHLHSPTTPFFVNGCRPRDILSGGRFKSKNDSEALHASVVN
jgi:hypothetical protein